MNCSLKPFQVESHWSFGGARPLDERLSSRESECGLSQPVTGGDGTNNRAVRSKCDRVYEAMEPIHVDFDPVRAYFRALDTATTTTTLPETVDLDSSQEDAAGKLVQRMNTNTFCPIITCAALKALCRQDTKPIVRWLRKELDAVRTWPVGHNTIELWRDSVVAKWHLFESTFHPGLAWTAFDGGNHDDDDGGDASFIFSPEALGSCWRQLVVGHSKLAGCAACRGNRSKRCSSNLVGHLLDSFPSLRTVGDCAFPYFEDFSDTQVAAWSLAMSLMAFAHVARALSGLDVERIAYDLLNSWSETFSDVFGTWNENECSTRSGRERMTRSLPWVDDR